MNGWGRHAFNLDLTWLNPKQGPLPFFSQVRILKDLAVRFCNKIAGLAFAFLLALALDQIEVLEGGGALASPGRLWDRRRCWGTGAKREVPRPETRNGMKKPGQKRENRRNRRRTCTTIGYYRLVINTHYGYLNVFDRQENSFECMGKGFPVGWARGGAGIVLDGDCSNAFHWERDQGDTGRGSSILIIKVL